MTSNQARSLHSEQAVDVVSIYEALHKQIREQIEAEIVLQRRLENLQTASAMRYCLEIFEATMLEFKKQTLSYDESAEFLGCDKRTVERMKQKGFLVATEGEKGVRFTVENLLAANGAVGNTAGSGPRARTSNKPQATDQSARVQVNKVKRTGLKDAA